MMGGKMLAFMHQVWGARVFTHHRTVDTEYSSMTFCAWVCFGGWSSGNMTAFVGTFELARRQPKQPYYRLRPPFCRDENLWVERKSRRLSRFIYEVWESEGIQASYNVLPTLFFMQVCALVLIQKTTGWSTSVPASDLFSCSQECSRNIAIIHRHFVVMSGLLWSLD